MHARLPLLLFRAIVQSPTGRHPPFSIEISWPPHRLCFRTLLRAISPKLSPHDFPSSLFLWPLPLLLPHPLATLGLPCFFSTATFRQDLGSLDDLDDQSVPYRLSGKAELDMALNSLLCTEVVPSVTSCMSFLKACIKKRSAVHVEKIHEFLTNNHVFLLGGLVGDYLVLALAKCGAVEDAYQLSKTLPSRSVFSWSAIISGYAECGHGHESLKMYQCMLKDGVEPNVYTFVSLCKACGSLRDLVQGMGMHLEGTMKGFTFDSYVCNTLVSMYGKCGAILEAENVFISMSRHNIVSWTAMLSAYASQGHSEKVLRLYRQMQETGVRAELLTFGIVLDACSNLAEKKFSPFAGTKHIREIALEIGRALHGDARRKGYTSETLVCNTLLTMYGKCGTVEEAENVFFEMPEHDVISWTAMLSAYVQQGQAEKALCLHDEMQKNEICLNEITTMSILQACSDTGCLDIANSLHFGIISAGYDEVSLVQTTLIYAYGSCASMVDAKAVFDNILDPDMVSWTACIDGHAGEGNATATLQMFDQSCMECVKPSSLTFNSVLVVCCHRGLTVEGHDVLRSMSFHYGIHPDLKQYGIMIDLFGRAGDFKRVEDMLQMLPMEANLTIWLCLLRACHTHGNLKLAKRAFLNAIRLQPDLMSTYILMSNICSNVK